MDKFESKLDVWIEDWKEKIEKRNNELFGNLEEEVWNFESINFDAKREWEDSDAKDIAELEMKREWHFTLSDIKEAVEKEEKEIWLPMLEKS